MNFDDLGWSPALQQALNAHEKHASRPCLTAGRVLVEHRGSYQLGTPQGVKWAKITGRLRHQARDRRDLPAVGDWVAVGTKGRIEAVLPRRSIFLRKLAGERVEPQVIAANLDIVFVVTSANQEFNPKRIERYVAAIRDGGAEPRLVLNKIDLCDAPETFLEQLPASLTDVPVIRTSAVATTGRHLLLEPLQRGITVAMVGSSGVGKSTLINWLLERDDLPTAQIREQDGHGRHTTTRRELFAVRGGASIIDTPGMREFALWSDDPERFAESFEDIDALARSCRFPDCQHEDQPGCAVQQAVTDGSLRPERVASHRKMVTELRALTQGQYKSRSAPSGAQLDSYGSRTSRRPPTKR